MKKFSFNLEPVLNHRRLLEEQEQQALAKILQSLNRVEQEEARLRNLQECQRKELSQPEPGDIDVETLRHRIFYLEKLERELEELSKQGESLRRDQQAQTEKLVEARKQRETLEKLKERSLSSFLKQADRLEQKLLDEFATLGFEGFDRIDLPTKKPTS